MQIRNLGGSGLRVSAVGLGCNNFGQRTDLVRNTDDPDNADYLRSLRGGSERSLARHLRAAE